MDLRLPSPPVHLKAPGKRGGASAELWVGENLYCPNCTAPRLEPKAPNNPVVDFSCPRCGLGIQAKGKSGPFGAAFANSAYQRKVDAIRARTLPDYALVQYDRDAWRVRAVTLIPGFFITERLVEKRNPLRPTARRAGWEGSNVRIGGLPADAKVPVVRNGRPEPMVAVRRAYARFAYLRQRTARQAAWTVDVLAEIRRVAPLVGTRFRLQDFYAEAEPRLAAKHPENRHVRDKIRQQLQVLRDQGFLQFLPDERGAYVVQA